MKTEAHVDSLPYSEPPATALEVLPDSSVSLFERLATNPDVDVEKLQRLIDMQERILAHNAKSEYDAAFSEMQGELPVITERGEIEVNGVVRSRYAKYEDIIEVIRPILKKYGFGLRHKNVQLDDGKLRIVGILSHRAGHREEDGFDCVPDTSGAKTVIQANGSTRSYGQRYTTISLLNIVTRGTDNDGATATKPEVAKVPDKYEDWWTDMISKADEGFDALDTAWNKTKNGAFKAYTIKHNHDAWKKLREKAAGKK